MIDKAEGSVKIRITKTFWATVVIVGGLAATMFSLLPIAGERLTALPGFSSLFASAIFVAELSTSFLLLTSFRRVPQVSVLILASTYLFSAVMAAFYVLTFPDALVRGAPLLGGTQTVGWIFMTWTSGYAVLALTAVVTEAFWSARLPQRRADLSAAITLTVTAALAISIAFVAIKFAESLPALVAIDQWSLLDWMISYLMPAALLCSTVIIFLVIGARSALFLWLGVALSALAFGSLLSTMGGGRFTIGWYAYRLAWLLSACSLFIYFIAQFARQHGLLLRAADDLAERTRERDRIWSVSEDLLGVSNFEGYFVSINPAWIQLLAWSEDEIKTMHVSELRHPDDASHSTAGRAQLAAGTQTVRMENRFRHKNGSWRWIAWTMTADRGLIYVAGRHITAEKDAAEALRKANADRAHLQKMEALGQLTGGVAHDFNNLLMIVSGYISRIRNTLTDGSKAANAAEAIETAVQRGKTLTRQLLSFSRRQTVNPTVIDIPRRIEAVRPILGSSIELDDGLTTEVAPELWPVKVDSSEFELALLNLVLNARDASGPADKIGIMARNVVLRPGDTPENLDGEFVAIAVADRGTGIPPDIVTKVFEPFFTTKRPDKGTGLGLSQVHGFTHQSGGTVTIESTLGQGTVVTLYLPRTHARPEPSASAVVGRNPGGLALLVEDNPEVAEVSKDLLNQAGYKVYAASDAQQAYSIFKQHVFNLLLSDIVMAGPMNGIDFVLKIRKLQPDLPIILMTGYAGAFANIPAEFMLLRKPYQLRDLEEAISQVCAACRSERAATDE